MANKYKMILDHRWALGDSILLTGLVRDFHRSCGDRYEILVEAAYREIFEHNPYCRTARKEDYENAQRIKITYQRGIVNAGRGQHIHMLSEFHRNFREQTGLPVYLQEPKGDLHLTPEELIPIVEGPYWLILAGGKADVTIKHWRPSHWQQVVDRLRADGINVVQTGATFAGHTHPPLAGVTDLVGKYHNARQLMNLVYHAQGVICPITAAMHIAACFDKPCVVVAGGREEPWWEGYTNQYGAFGDHCTPVAVEHRYLHTIGKLNCCEHKGCWKHRVVPLRTDDSIYNRADKLCKKPGDGVAAMCMDMITPDQVVEAVRAYATESRGTIAVRSRPLLQLRQPVCTPEVQAQRVDANSRDIQKAVLGSPRQIDHPIIGGRFTVFVLSYGDHEPLLRRCVDSILRTIPRELIDLRIGLNAASDASHAYACSVEPTVIYNRPENPKKYPLMRQMFHDSAYPITTPYLAWFDDDTQVVDGSMWSQLCEAIIANHLQGCRLYGTLMSHNVMSVANRGTGHDPTRWFKQAPWHRNRAFRVRSRGQEAPNGSIIDFAVGYFWAMATEMIQRADIPCNRLNHNGGDITIGEQIHQAGAKIKTFNPNKTLVWCPTRENGGRRGYSEVFPWSKP